MKLPKALLALMMLISIVTVSLLLYVFTKKQGAIQNPITKDDQTASPLLFSKVSSWGPCASPVEGDCYESIKIWTKGLVEYSTNSVTKTQEQQHLSSEQIEKLTILINETGILNKNCELDDKDRVMDLSKTHIITVGAKSKTIEFPACEAEVKQIDTLVQGFIKK